MNASQVMSGFTSAHGGWLLAGLMLLGSGSSTVALAQDVVVAGGGHSCAMLGDRLQCWGANEHGQLGNGTTTPSNMPIPVTQIDGTVTAVAAGRSHTCAVVDGGLRCWGFNEDGQLGNGTMVSSSLPVEVFPPGSDVTAVSAGRAHTCAVIGGGLACWGSNADGRLGTGNIDPSTTPINVFAPGTGVTAVAAGSSHSCAVTNGEARCWGYNGSGQLGTNNTENWLTPILVSGPITNAVGIIAGISHSCALLDTGGVQCWGGNANGQLGNDTLTNSLVPVTVYTHLIAPPQSVPFSGAISIAAGTYHTCATTSTASYCWGSSDYGQLGANSTADSNFASPVSLGSPANAIAAGGAHTCAIGGGSVFCWGSNESGQLGDAAVSPYVPAPFLSITGFQHVSAGDRHACATSAGGAYCWGWNPEGQLGNGAFDNSATPQVVSQLGPGSSVRLMAAGQNHSCAWTDTGVGGVSCWGYNEYGQLGNSTTTDSPTPVAVAGLSDTVSLAASGFHTCVARSGGGVQCWGFNEHGQLGNGTSVSSTVPVNVEISMFFPLSGATEITSGSGHNCAVVNGGAYCWGLNVFGQLGDGSTNEAHRATGVVGLGSGSGVTAMSAGGNHTCAMVNEGVQCWGRNTFGQLGTGVSGDSTTPVFVSNLDSGVTAVASGGAHACAIVDGGVQCWGYNAQGQLGDGSFLDSNVPVTALPPGSGIDKITAGSDYTCATNAAENATWCWGNGMFGKLANGKLGYEDLPVEVAIFGNGFE